MRIAIALAVLMLAGCASGPSLTNVMSGCGYDTKSFTEAWPCVRQGMAGARGAEDLKAVYVASGDFTAQQVATGKMTDAEAKLAMAQVRQRLNASDANPVADAVVLGSIMNRTPVGSTPAAPFMTNQRIGVQCHRFGASIQCY